VLKNEKFPSVNRAEKMKNSLQCIVLKNEKFPSVHRAEKRKIPFIALC
jgi:hypothetical protein